MENDPKGNLRQTTFNETRERVSRLLQEEDRLTASAGPLVDLVARLHSDLAELDKAIGEKMWHRNSQGTIANPLLTHRAKTIQQIAALLRELKLTAPPQAPQKSKSIGAQPRDRSRNSQPPFARPEK